MITLRRVFQWAVMVHLGCREADIRQAERRLVFQTVAADFPGALNTVATSVSAEAAAVAAAGANECHRPATRGTLWRQDAALARLASNKAFCSALRCVCHSIQRHLAAYLTHSKERLQTSLACKCSGGGGGTVNTERDAKAKPAVTLSTGTLIAQNMAAKSAGAANISKGTGHSRSPSQSPRYYSPKKKEGSALTSRKSTVECRPSSPLSFCPSSSTSCLTSVTSGGSGSSSGVSATTIRLLPRAAPTMREIDGRPSLAAVEPLTTTGRAGPEMPRTRSVVFDQCPVYQGYSSINAGSLEFSGHGNGRGTVRLGENGEHQHHSRSRAQQRKANAAASAAAATAAHDGRSRGTRTNNKLKCGDLTGNTKGNSMCGVGAETLRRAHISTAKARAFMTAMGRPGAADRFRRFLFRKGGGKLERNMLFWQSVQERREMHSHPWPDKEIKTRQLLTAFLMPDGVSDLCIDAPGKCALERPDFIFISRWVSLIPISA